MEAASIRERSAGGQQHCHLHCFPAPGGVKWGIGWRTRFLMAFCTSCGATVQGAFCQQCGTPLGATAAQSAAPQAAPATQAPVKGKISPIVWILLAVAGVFVLGIIGLVGAGLFVAHTVVNNPGLVLGKIISAQNPDAEVLDTDPGSQTMRIRDRKTGEEVTLSFDDIKKGKLKFSARGKDGVVANMEIGGGAGKLPSWVPTYPGAKAQGNMTANGESGDGTGEGGIVTFTTLDPASKVTAFYEAKIKEMGMRVDLSALAGAGSMVMGEDEGRKRTLHVMVAGGSGETTFTVTYGRKR
jgi:hypothetical protein